MMKHRIILSSIVAFTVTICASSFDYKAYSADPGQEKSAIDNFAQVDTIATAPLGKLGHVEKRGKGPVPIILVSPSDFEWSSFREFMNMDQNATRYTMYAITMPGYGGSAPPPMPPSVNMSHSFWLDAVEDGILQLLETEKMQRPIVLGYSVSGGYIAMRLGLDRPDKFRGVVVVSGAPMSSPPVAKQPADMKERWKVMHEEVIPFLRSVTKEIWNGPMQSADRQFTNDLKRSDEIKQMILRRPVPVSVRYAAESWMTDLRPEIPGFTIPLLVVASSAIKNENWEKLKASTPKMTIEYVEGVKSWCIVQDQPEKLSILVAKFADGL